MSGHPFGAVRRWRPCSCSSHHKHRSELTVEAQDHVSRKACGGEELIRLQDAVNAPVEAAHSDGRPGESEIFLGRRRFLASATPNVRSSALLDDHCLSAFSNAWF